MRLKNILFLLFILATIAFYYQPLKDLIVLALRYNELYSHIVLIPFVSMYFMFLSRKEIVPDARYAAAAGIPFIVAGIALYLIAGSQGIALSKNDYLSAMTSSVVLLWLGGFIVVYGTRSFMAAAFPLLFLVFMIPVPDALMEKVIYQLQVGSTEVTHLLFWLTGIPFYRDGFLFYLQGISIEVAEQCSGIRSSIALLIVSVLAGKVFLKSTSRKLALAVSVFPITIFKNGVRIVMLSLLGTYVDPRILDSNLHKRGGIPIFIFAFLLLMGVLWLVKRTEKEKSDGITHKT